MESDNYVLCQWAAESVTRTDLAQGSFSFFEELVW